MTDMALSSHKRRSILGAVCASALLTAVVGCTSSPSGENAPPSPVAQSQEQPNVLMILLDDLGYTDLGAYGGEADTPHLDQLTQEATQFTNFHAYPLCAPTRAALLTGQDPHRVGLGSMEDVTPPGVPQTTPGYKGSLEGEFTGMAELLGDNGYDTYQVGKWHLGTEEGQTPQDLGFDKNFTLYDAAASYYSDGLRFTAREEEKRGERDFALYERNGEVVESLPDDFYATHSYTDEMISMIDESQDSDRPFFGYLAHTAPHDPLHIDNPELVNKYLDIYLDDYNYNDLRENRIQRMVELGLLDGENATRWPVQTPEWDTLNEDQRYDLAYRMAVYSAIVEDLDTQVGRVIDHLKETGEYDNTLLVVASDNGAASASRELYTGQPGQMEWQNENYPLIGDVEAYGQAGSFPSLGLPNAQVSSGPFFHTKTTVFEGGTRVPAIIKTPGTDGNSGARVVDTFAHITDLYPTFAEYAGADLAASGTLLGDSAKPLLEGTSETIGDDEFGMELFGHRAYRSGDWKLVFAPELQGGTGEYSLYNLAEDPGETRDLAAERPDIVEELSRKWDQYAEDNGVVAVEFEAVNEVAPKISKRMYSIDWAQEAPAANE